MKRIIFLILTLAMLFPSGNSMAVENINVWREFYVSPDASENGDGSKENPFDSIEKAQQEIRAINDKQSGDIIVNIAPGEYELSESLSFNVEDSGKNGYHIIYRGNKENPPVISGGERVSGFELFNVQKNIYRASVSDVDAIREIYVNGQRRYVAQTNTEISAEKKPEKYTTLEYYNANPRAPKNDYTYYNPNTVYQYDGFYVSKKYIDIFENQQDIEIFWNHEFREAIFHVDEIKQDPDREDVVIVTLKQNAYDLIMKDPGYFELPPFGDFWVRNAYELLDTPGEFYFNEAERMLYYIPFENENMETAEVIVPRLERLMSLVGNNDDDRVKNISFENLEFAYSTWLSHVDTDWYTWQGPESLLYTNTRVDAAIRVFISENIDFTGNIFHSIGSTAISMANNVINSDVVGNCFYDIGATTVQIGSPNTRNYHCALTREAFPQHGKNGELLNLLTDVDSNVSGSFFGEYDNWSVVPSKSINAMGTLRGGRNGMNYSNGFYQSFMAESDYGQFKGAWQSDPYAALKGEKSWIRYDMLDRYTIEEITLIFDKSSTTTEQRRGFEVLLSNDRFFKEGTYYKVAEQVTDAGANVSYHVNSDDKYRFLMIRTIGATPLALTSATATTKDRTTFYQYGECKNINIENNYIERVNLDFPNSTGLFVMHGNNIEVNHNYIKNVPYSGISLGWGWNKGRQVTYDENGNYVLSASGGSSNGLIHAGFNRIEKAGQQANDGGGIYTLGGFQSGSSIHDNYIYNMGIGYRAYYLDNGTSRIDVYNNVAEDVYAFTSASYDGAGKSEEINLYNNFSTNSVTHSIDEPSHRLQKTYPWGQYPEEVYNIIAKAGLEEKYKYLTDIPCEGYYNLLDEDTVYKNGDRVSFTSKMADALIESANIILSEGKFGEGLGEYPYAVYYEIKAAKEKLESVSSYNTSDVFEFRKLLREAGKSVNRKTPTETLALCENLLSAAQAFEETPVEGKYPIKAIQEFNAEITKYKALADKTDYAALKALEDAYNTFISQEAGYNIIYVYADGMKDVCIDNETDEIIMYFSPGENLEEITLYVHAAKCASIADIFEKVDLSDGLQIPVFNELTNDHKMKNLTIKYMQDSERTDVLSRNAFIEADDGTANVLRFRNGILLTPSSNAVISSYLEIKDGLEMLKLMPLSPTGYTEFSMLFGVHSKEMFYKNSQTSEVAYIEAEFQDGYIELYFVNGNTKTFIDKKKYDIRNGMSYTFGYSLKNIGASMAFKLYIDGNTVFDKLMNGNTTSDAWGYYSTVNSLYIE